MAVAERTFLVSMMVHFNINGADHRMKISQ